MTSVCSPSWIIATATANEPPARSPASAPGFAAAPSAAARSVSASIRCVAARIAHGTTSSDASGAARMPAATAICPEETPTRAAIGKRMRATDSNRTSPP